MSKFYLIAVYDDGLISPIGTVGYDAKRVASQRRWQEQGQFQGVVYHTCQPHTFARGVMQCQGTGKMLRMERGALTERAFAEYLDSIWGPEGEITKTLEKARARHVSA